MLREVSIMSEEPGNFFHMHNGPEFVFLRCQFAEGAAIVFVVCYLHLVAFNLRRHALQG